MLKKITGSIMTIMLMTTMFLGVLGVTVPEPVHADDDGYWELTLAIDSFSANDTDCISSIRCLTVRTGGGRKKKKAYESRTVTLSDLHSRPENFEFQINEYPNNRKVTEVLVGEYNEGDGEDSEDVFLGTYTWHYSYKLRYLHYRHRWTYGSDGNVITAECEGPWECPLADNNPTLTLSANGKTYDGKPVNATLSPNSTWKTDNGLLEINEENITYSPDNSKNAGTYTASYNAGGVTATKEFTIEKAPVIIMNLKIKDKPYDGTTKADVDTSEAVFYGAIPGEDIGYKVSAEFEDADEGWGKPVHLTYELTGTDAGNYYLDPKMMEYISMSLKGTIYAEGKGGPDDYDDYDEDSGAEGSGSSVNGSGKAAGSSKSSPNTGDPNDITGFLAMMLASAAALGVMGYRRVRENRK